MTKLGDKPRYDPPYWEERILEGLRLTKDEVFNVTGTKTGRWRTNTPNFYDVEKKVKSIRVEKSRYKNETEASFTFKSLYRINEDGAIEKVTPDTQPQETDGQLLFW